MKQYFLYLMLVLMSGLMTISCSSSSDEPEPNPEGGNGGEQTTEDRITMYAYLQQGSEAKTEVGPRYVATVGKSMLADIRIPDHPEMMVLSYADDNDKNDGTMIVTEHYLIIMHHNIYNDSILPSSALVIGDFDNYSSIAAADIDWTSGEVTINEDSKVSIPGLTARSLPSDSLATRASTEDNLRGMFIDFTNSLCSTLSEKNDVLEGVEKATAVLGMGDTFGCMTKIVSRFNSLVQPSMIYLLSSDDGIAAQNETVTQLISNDLESALKDDILDAYKDYVLKAIPVKKSHVGLCLWAAKMANKSLSDSDASNLVSSDDNWQAQYIEKAQQQTRMIGTKMHTAATATATAAEQQMSKMGVVLTVNIDNVGEDNVTLSGTAVINDETYLSYSSVGFSCEGGEDALKGTTRLTNGRLEPLTLSGLQPATQYYVRAFYDPVLSSKTFFSTGRYFVTRGTLFKPSQNDLELQPAGQTATVTMSLGYGTTWRVVSSPDWCQCTPSTAALTITAGSAPSDRQGEIRLESTNYYQQTTSATITIRQKGAQPEEDDDDEGGGGGGGDIALNACKWRLTGNISSDGEIESVTMILDLSDIANGNVVWTEDGESQTYNNSTYTTINSNSFEVLLPYTNYGYWGGGTFTNAGTIKFTFTLTGSSTGTCTLYNVDTYTDSNGEKKTSTTTGTFNCSKI